MNKAKKIFYLVWAVVTLILLLLVWWQRGQLRSLAIQRDRIRYQSMTTLLEEAAQMLDDSARYTAQGQSDQAARAVDVSLALLDAAGKAAESRQAGTIRDQWEEVQGLRPDVFKPARPDELQKQLRREAAGVRDLLRAVTSP